MEDQTLLKKETKNKNSQELPDANSPVVRKTWKEFRAGGFLWFVNRILHAFGWAICCVLDDDGNVVEVYPSRVLFRGFDLKSESEGFIKLSKYIEMNAATLREEAEFEEESL